MQNKLLGNRRKGRLEELMRKAVEDPVIQNAIKGVEKTKPVSGEITGLYELFSKKIETNGEKFGITYDPDGKIAVASGSFVGRYIVDYEYNNDLIATLATFKHKYDCRCVDFDDDAKSFVIGCEQGPVILFEDWNEEVKQIKLDDFNHVRYRHKNSISGVALKDNFLAIGAKDKYLRLYNKTTFDLVNEVRLPDFVTGLDFNPDGSLLAAGCLDGYVRLFWTKNLYGKVVKLVKGKGRDYAVNDVSFDPSGKYLACCGSFGSIYVYEFCKGDLEEILISSGRPEDKDKSIYSIAFSLDGRYLATADEDEKITIHRVERK